MPNPLPELRHLSTCLQRPLWVGVAAIALIAATSIAGDPADDDFDENAAQPEQLVEVVDRTVYGWVFGQGSDAIDARQKVDAGLRQKLAIVNQVCGLTDSQYRKLELAGRGDIKRLFDHIEVIGNQRRVIKNDLNKLIPLCENAKQLQRGLKLGASDSLFGKFLNKTLKPGQLERYEAIQSVFRAGGKVRMLERSSGNVLEIILSGTAFADDGLMHFGELPPVEVVALDGTRVTDAGLVYLKGQSGLKVLLLGNTQVTDRGVAQLAGMTSLQTLRLNNTQITDASVAYLEEMNELQFLSLYQTRVTDAGLAHVTKLTGLKELSLYCTGVSQPGTAELQQAMPGLTIHR